MSALCREIQDDLMYNNISTDIVVLSDKLDIEEDVIYTTMKDLKRMIQINHKFIGHKHIVFQYDYFYLVKAIFNIDIGSMLSVMSKVIASGDITLYFKANKVMENMVRNIPYVEGLMIREVVNVKDDIWKCIWDKVNIYGTGKYAPYDKNKHIYHNIMPFTTN